MSWNTTNVHLADPSTFREEEEAAAAPGAHPSTLSLADTPDRRNEIHLARRRR